MAKITRTRTYETSIARIVIGGRATIAVEWQLVDAADRSVESETVGREVDEQPPEVQAAVATIMAYAETVTEESASEKEATEEAALAAAVASKVTG